MVEKIKGYDYDGNLKLFISHHNFEDEKNDMCPVSGDSIHCVDLKEVAHKIGRELESYFDVWRDTEVTKSYAVNTFDKNKPIMEKAIDQCDLFVAVIPEGDYSESYMFTNEYPRALRLRKPIFHVYLGDATTKPYENLECEACVRLEYKNREWECDGYRNGVAEVIKQVVEWGNKH